MKHRPSAAALCCVALGGALGAVLRHVAGEAFEGHLLIVTIAINAVGSALLTMIGLRPAIRDSALWGPFLGPGLLGGFTTFSAASEHTRGLLADERLLAAAGYLLLTMGLAVTAVVLVQAIALRRARSAR